MYEIGALEVKALLCRGGGEQLKVELKVSTCVLLQTTAYRSTVSFLRDGQMSP